MPKSVVPSEDDSRCTIHAEEVLSATKAVERDAIVRARTQLAES